MNGKKLLAFFLAFVMMFATMSFPALADDGETSDYVAQIGDVKYDTLVAAMYDAKDTEKTITLLKNVVFDNPLNGSGLPAYYLQGFTLDLNEKVLYLTETDYRFKNVTFENGTVEVTAKTASTAIFYMLDNDTTITFDNVVVNANDLSGTYLIGSCGHVNVLNKSVINVEPTTQKDLTAVICLTNKGNIEIDNSQINHSNVNGRTILHGTITVSGDSAITSNNVKQGIYLDNDGALTVKDTAKINITTTDTSKYGIELGKNTEYNVAKTAEVNATVYPLPAVEMNGKSYNTLADAMADLENCTGDVTIELLADCDYAFGARVDWNHEGTVTINGNGNVLNLKGTDTDWSSIANNGGKIVFNDMTINKTEEGNGAWNNHAINFKSEVEMNDVVVNNSVTVDSDATFNNVKFNEDGEYYCLYIEAEERNVVVDNCTFTATNNGRGIKIIDQYTATGKVNLTVTNSTFETAKKAAILVTSTKGATITAYGNDITNVAADSEHLVWVDEDRAKYASEVKVVDLSGNEIKGAVKVEGAEAVAKIGEVEYDSLAKAIANAIDGETVTLLANASGDGIVFAENKFATNGITIDLNGNTYTISGKAVGSPGSETNGFQLLKDNKITIKNGTITSTADVVCNNEKYGEHTKASILIQNYANLTLDSVTLDGSNLLNVNWTPYTLSDCNGKIVITNSTITAKEGGFAFDVDNKPGYNGVTVTIDEDSVVKGLVQIARNNREDSTTVATLVIGENSYTDNGVYAKNGDKFDMYVAQIGKTYYATLAEAVAKANDGDTVTLLANASGNGVEIVNEKFKEDGLVIDLGGYTYTIVDETVGSEGTKTAGFHFGSDNNITIKNGKVYSEVAKHLVQNYANLTLDGVTMDGSKLNYDKTQDTYTVSHSNGTLTLKSGTTVIGGANGYAFDVSEFGSYKGAKAVVESDAIVKGKVEVKNWKNETFTGVLVDANKKEYTTEGVYTQQEDGSFKLFEESETPEVPEFFNKMLIGRKAATKENFDGTKYYPVKFYAAIDDPTKYKEVGFTITATKKDGTTVTRTLSTTTVYKQITISSEENTEVIKAEILGGTYMYGGELLFTSTEWDNASVNLTIIPYAVTNEGVTLTGKTQNVAEPFKE